MEHKIAFICDYSFSFDISGSLTRFSFLEIVYLFVNYDYFYVLVLFLSVAYVSRKLPELPCSIQNGELKSPSKNP